MAPGAASIRKLEVTALIFDDRGRSLKVLRLIAFVDEKVGVEVAIFRVFARVGLLIDLIHPVELLVVGVLAGVCA